MLGDAELSVGARDHGLTTFVCYWCELPITVKDKIEAGPLSTETPRMISGMD